MPPRKKAKPEAKPNALDPLLAANLVARLDRQQLEQIVIDAIRTRQIAMETISDKLPTEQQTVRANKIIGEASHLWEGDVGSFNALSFELVESICVNWLDFPSRLVLCSAVCKGFRAFLKNERLWRTIGFSGCLKRGWKRSGSTDTESMRSFGESRLILSEDKMDRTLAMLLRLPGIERLTLSTLGNQKRYTDAINAIGDRLKAFEVGKDSISVSTLKTLTKHAGHLEELCMVGMDHAKNNQLQKIKLNKLLLLRACSSLKALQTRFNDCAYNGGARLSMQEIARALVEARGGGSARPLINKLTTNTLSGSITDWCLFSNLGTFFPEIRELTINSWNFGRADTLEAKFDSDKDLKVPDKDDVIDSDTGARLAQHRAPPKPLPTIMVAPAMHLTRISLMLDWHKVRALRWTLKQIMTGYPSLESLRVHTGLSPSYYDQMSIEDTFEGLGHDKLRILSLNNIACNVCDFRDFAVPAIEAIEVRHTQRSKYDDDSFPADDALATAADAETAAALGFVLHLTHADPVASPEQYCSTWIAPKIRGYRLLKRKP